MTASSEFLAKLEAYYAAHGRDLPWRYPDKQGKFNPYKILVSEVMLQQTQVTRVIPKYEAFLDRFPDINSLASATLGEVLAQWAGLGYNRRAKYLWMAAKKLKEAPQPWSQEVLVACPGIGPNTASAVIVYAYDQPVLFIETNIRTVVIHHFFAGKQGITDKEILKQLEQSLPIRSTEKHVFDSPRLFYWAMMDYGSFLKSSIGNLNKQSKSYARQSKFHGSQRQIRGRIIRELTSGPIEIVVLKQKIADPRFGELLETLQREQLVTLQDKMVMLYNE